MRWGIFALTLAVPASAAQAQGPVHAPGVPSKSDPRPIAVTTWITPSDFPREAMQRQVSVIRFRLKVDATGVPTSCEILSTSGVPALDSHTCRLLQQRARFRPGVNAAGKPVAGTYSSAVRWQIPPSSPPPPPKYDRDSWRYRLKQ
ncbi:energy transducer TonB [Croceicoccus estronivorus]|uniref:energy transducer TonB n=1 Tax=Croceicoccus estronivorus TaxID=1172626 RepID=UPI0009EE709A